MASFIRYYLPAVLWAALIALLSTSGFGPSFTFRVVKAVAHFFDPTIPEVTLHTLNAVVRKLGHVTEYFVLALLVWRAVRQDAAERWRWRWAGATFAAGLLWAALDETHQLFEHSRGGSFRDVGWDSLGILLALLVLGAHAWRTPR